MNLKSQIGNRLKIIREHFKETQGQFGDRFGCNQAQISKYELGNVDLPEELKSKLFDMGISLDWLITGNGSMLTGPKTIGERLSLVRRIIGWDRTQISDMMTVDPEDYAKWEDDIEEPEYDALRRLEGNTLYSRSWIMTGKGPMQITPDQIQKRSQKEDIPQESFGDLFPGVYKMYLENRTLKDKVKTLSEIENEYCQLDQTKKIMTKAYIQALFDQQKQQ